MAIKKAPKSNLHKAVADARKARDRAIISRARKGETHESIADDLGMTRQRVGQIVKAAATKGGS